MSPILLSWFLSLAAGGQPPSKAMEAPKLHAVKTVIRVRDYARSRRFYEEVLGLPVVEEWNEEGDVGCIFGFGGEPRSGYLEISPTSSDPHHRPLHGLEANAKIELQMRTESLDSWVERFSRSAIPFEGPFEKPWGNRYLWVRDPDGVRIGLFRGSH